ncbi:cell envelope integrity protein CreD [Sphingomicrobium flavum]|uniref:cell envelope integrity protein CreD n=1 Tax=Sphingomicrobium flavum TaxID=1229164 RepID=UPI0021ADA59F|nr:cell envelope integrity protein CreD [Sphingomicrobium flavum]
MGLLRGDEGGRTPGQKLAVAVLVGIMLIIPLFMTWAMVYDRQGESQTAQASIAEGWGGPQRLAGPVLVLPYLVDSVDVVTEDGQQRSVTRTVRRHFTLSPQTMELDTSLEPGKRERSIYEVIVYEAALSGSARFALPDDLQRYDVDPERIEYDRAELRFAISDPKGLGANPEVTLGGEKLALQPGYGSDGGAGFFAFADASALEEGALETGFSFGLKGNGLVALDPDAGNTTWTVRSSWPHPSFSGAYLPDHDIGADGFTATYSIGNLALGRSLVSTETARRADSPMPVESYEGRMINAEQSAVVSLIEPVDLYSQVDRAAKYGFLHIGFTFLALLMFDVVGGKRVSPVVYLLVGAALVLFFVLLLAFAEIIGFAAAYVVASTAIAGLVTLYSKAILGGWRPALAIGGLLGLLYAALYILLGLENLSLLIGSLMLFAALAAVMYATRNLDWSQSEAPVEAG